MAAPLPTPDTADATPLGRLVLRGLGFSLAGQVLNRLGLFATGIVLARLLTPEDFGVYAVALLTVNLVGALNEMGVMPSIIRWQATMPQIERTGATLAGAASLLLYVLIFFAAPFIATAASSPGSVGLIRIMTAALLIDGAVAVPHARLRGTFRQDLHVAAELGGMVAYVATAVMLASLGAGPLSIAIGHLTSVATAGALVVVLARHWVWPGFDREAAGRILSFGTPLCLAELVWQAVLNLDYLVVGRTLGTVSLGLYLLAFNLSSWPVSVVGMAVSRVSFAGFARVVEDRERLRYAFERAFGLALAGLLPMVTILAVLSPELVRFLYGDKWLPAAEPLRFLLLLGGLRVLMDVLSEVLAADGRSRFNLLIRLLWAVVLVPSLFLGARQGGILGVAVAHGVVAACVAGPLMVLGVRLCGITTRTLVNNLPRPLLGAGLAAAAMLLVGQLLQGDFLRLIVLGPIGVVVYAAAVLPASELASWSWGQLRSLRSEAETAEDASRAPARLPT